MGGSMGEGSTVGPTLVDPCPRASRAFGARGRGHGSTNVGPTVDPSPMDPPSESYQAYMGRAFCTSSLRVPEIPRHGRCGFCVDVRRAGQSKPGGRHAGRGICVDRRTRRYVNYRGTFRVNLIPGEEYPPVLRTYLAFEEPVHSFSPEQSRMAKAMVARARLRPRQPKIKRCCIVSVWSWKRYVECGPSLSQPVRLVCLKVLSPLQLRTSPVFKKHARVGAPVSMSVGAVDSYEHHTGR